jgi:hypothetical protein
MTLASSGLNILVPAIMTGGGIVPNGATLTIQAGGTLTCAAGSTCPSGGGSGTVTSVTIAGTSNQINATGTCVITSSGVCTLSIPNTYLASPPAIGGTAPAAGSFTNLTSTGLITGLTGFLYGNGASASTVATASQLGTLFASYIAGLSGCTTANYVYVPQGANCVAQSGGTGSQYQSAYFSNTNTVGAFGPGILGQVATSQGASAAPVYTSQGLGLGNGGSPVTASTYLVKCDSGTTILDRGTVIVFQSGASAITLPDTGNTGCGAGFAFKIIDDAAGTITISRQTSSTINIANGTANSDGQTSFTMGNGAFATFSADGSGHYWVTLTQ